MGLESRTSWLTPAYHRTQTRRRPIQGVRLKKAARLGEGAREAVRSRNKLAPSPRNSTCIAHVALLHRSAGGMPLMICTWVSSCQTRASLQKYTAATLHVRMDSPSSLLSSAADRGAGTSRFKTWGLILSLARNGPAILNFHKQVQATCLVSCKSTWTPPPTPSPPKKVSLPRKTSDIGRLDRGIVPANAPVSSIRYLTGGAKQASHAATPPLNKQGAGRCIAAEPTSRISQADTTSDQARSLFCRHRVPLNGVAAHLCEMSNKLEGG
ncbi:hypothetical protein F5Y15DRAFT_344990 [Xylariaceae sp. FL0016]|nr:hypothetical protein F5Y15DRAFT_344990 [Xylariaceae sp. FL0016]